MKLVLSLIIVILGLTYGCSPKIQQSSGEVNFLYKEAQGTIAVKSIGYGKNRADAIVDAQKNAFNIILFKGLPGTELNIPLVDDENNAKLKHENYFDSFFGEGNYKQFMMSSTESSNLIKMRGYKKISIDMKINYNSLLKELEQRQIVRKFGF